MTFVLVGGGPTGVELAGALGEIANDTLRSDFRSIRPQDARIELIEAVDRILPMYPPDRSASAAAQLARLGVTVRTRTRVVDIGDAYVRVEDEHGVEETIGARTVLWAAGVLAASFGRAVAEAAGAETDRSGRIQVGRGPRRSRATRRSSWWATRPCSRGRTARPSRAWRRAASRAASTPAGWCWRG